jgi:hypothetical protein
MGFVFATAVMVYMGAALVWELATGSILDRRWKPTHRRTDNPAIYWIAVVFDFIFFMAVAAIFVSTGHAFFGRH